jgi:hypothetical protein
MIFGDDRLGPRDLGQGHVALGLGLVHFLLRGCLVLAQLREAVQRGLRQLGLRLLRLELRLFDRDVEGHEDGAGVHHLAGRELHPTNGTRQLVAQGDPARREHGAD